MLVKQYNVYKSGELIGTHTGKEIEKLIGINNKSISEYCKTGRKYQNTYIFKENGKCEPERVITGELADTWNEIRECAKLISSGQAVIRQIGNEKFTCRRKNKI